MLKMLMVMCEHLTEHLGLITLGMIMRTYDINRQIASKTSRPVYRTWPCASCGFDLRFTETGACINCKRRAADARKQRGIRKAVRTLRRRRIREGLAAVAAMRADRAKRMALAAERAQEKKRRARLLQIKC